MSLISSHAKRDSRFAYIICLTSALFFFYDIIQNMMWNLFKKELITDMKINDTQFGTFVSLFSWGNALWVLPAGLVLSRYSIRRVLLGMVTLSTVAVWGSWMSSSLMSLSVFRALSGMANAFCFVGCAMLVNNWFSAQKRGAVMGCVIGIGVSGGSLASWVLPQIAASYGGWRSALCFLGIFGIILSIVLALVVRSQPAEDIREREEAGPEWQKLWEDFKRVVTYRHIWIYGLYTGLMNYAIAVLGGSEGYSSLMQGAGFTEDNTGVIFSMLFFGMIFGAPLLGWVSDKHGRRKTTMALGSFSAVFFFVWAIYYTPASVTFTAGLWFAVGFFSGVQTISYPAIAESTPVPLISTATGLAAALIMSITALHQMVAGRFLTYAKGTDITNYSSYINNEYHLIFTLGVASFLIGLMLIFCMRETYCKPLSKSANR